MLQNQTVILSKRLTDFSHDTELGGAQSKDLEDARLTQAARTFSTTEAREDAAVLVLGPGRKVVAQALDAGFSD